MSKTIIITESQNRFLRRLFLEDVLDLTQRECNGCPDEFDSGTAGPSGNVGGRERGLSQTDTIAKELSGPSYSRNGRNLTGY